MDTKEIQNLIKFIAKSGVNEVMYKDKNFTLKVKKEASTGTVMQPIVQAPSQNITSEASTPTATQTPPSSSKAVVENDKLITIKSPMIGTFYRKPSPDKENFISVGDTISENSVVCIIEAMKLFNEIEAEVTGKIVKILVEDSSPVEYEQPLFLVDPS